MTSQDQDFQARMKRVQARSGNFAPIPSQRSSNEKDIDERAMILAILRPQLALILGVLALIVGRAAAMNYFGVEPGTELLGFGEGAIIVVLLVAIGLLFGKSDPISHGALVVGAALGFLCESFYIPMAPDLMASVYNANYVGLVLLNAH